MCRFITVSEIFLIFISGNMGDHAAKAINTVSPLTNQKVLIQINLTLLSLPIYLYGDSDSQILWPIIYNDAMVIKTDTG